MLLKTLLAPTYVQMLTALSIWLQRVDVDVVGENALLTARLAPDMLPLSTQISFACAKAQEGVFGLKQEPLPLSITVLIDEGRNAAIQPGSIKDAVDKIAATIDLVQSAVLDAPEIDPSTFIVHQLPEGMIFDLTAEQFVRDWALPQFYFHVMTSYAILRQQGIRLGKIDYVAHMFNYVRPVTTPAQEHSLSQLYSPLREHDAHQPV